MVEKTDVAAVLELIRPSLQADGGDVKLIDVDEDGVVTVELQGACKGCPMASSASSRSACPASPAWCRRSCKQV